MTKKLTKKQLTKKVEALYATISKAQADAFTAYMTLYALLIKEGIIEETV
jgi:hypothetical protein